MNLPPGEHPKLFQRIREVGAGYTIVGTEWTYTEKNEIATRKNLIRLEDYTYTYDADGNLLSDGRSKYEWNARGQLTKVTFPDGFGEKYTYDMYGRRATKSQFNHQGNVQETTAYHYKGDSWTLTDEKDGADHTVLSYSFDEQGKPLTITYQGQTFWYVYNGHGDVMALTDKNGDIAARYEYDEWGLVTRMYNKYGERVREGIGWIGDLESGNGSPGSLQGPEDSSGNTEPDYHPGIGNAPADGTSTTADTAVTADAFAWLDGEPLDGIEEEPSEDITTELVKVNPYRYAGYYWDRKTQMYYLQARYYDPREARFISKDTYEGEIENPQSLNMYVYVLNNPLVNIDPSGHYCVSIDGNWAQPGSYGSPSSIDMGPNSAYIGRPIINRGVVQGRLVSGGRTEKEISEKGNYWKRYGLEVGFLGTWYANPKTVIQVLEFMKADIQRNGSIDTHKYANSGSIYIQAIVVAISTGKGREFGNEVISGIENIQAMYDLEDREKGVVDLDTINALIDNYKKKPEWLHGLNGAAYKLDWNFGEEFYQAVVFGIIGGSASKGTGQAASEGTGKVAKGPYSHLKDPEGVGPGKDFTAAQKQKIIEENMKRNGGVVKSDESGTILSKPKRSQKGVTPDPNEWQIDHIVPKSMGGTNSYSNAQVLSRTENRVKSNN